MGHLIFFLCPIIPRSAVVGGDARQVFKPTHTNSHI